MKNIYASFFATLLVMHCLLQTCQCTAQSFNFVWTQTGTGAGAQKPMANATDPAGNIYLAGYFGDTDIIFGNLTAHSPNAINSFLVKYSPAGTPLWLGSAVVPDNTQNIYTQAVATNGSGHVLITGVYSGSSISFGNDTLPVTSGSLYNMFITEYDSAGNVAWVKAATSDGDSYDYGLATDGDNNIYAAGFYNGDTVAFDSLTLYNYNYPGGRLIYLVKYNQAGTVQWAEQANPNSNATIESITTDRLGNIYVTGQYSSDSLTLGNMTVYNNHSNIYTQIFLFKLNPQGQAIWAKGFAETAADYGFCVAADQSNNVYLAGAYSSDSLNFGNVTIHNPTSGDGTSYIAKFDAAGNNLWAKTAVATLLNEVRGLTTDIKNNVYIAGEFTTSTISFDSTTLNVPGLSEGPVFLVGMDSTGKVLAANALRTGSESPAPLSADTFGNVYLGGIYGFGFGIDTFYAGTDTFYANREEFAYLSKINNNSAPVTSPIYHHLLDTVNIWHYTYNICFEAPGPGGNNGKSLATCGDPTIRGIVYTGASYVYNGITYLTLIAQSNPSNPDYQIPSDSCLLGLIREDTSTGKVYYLPADSASEILIYDFSMHIGESIAYSFYHTVPSPFGYPYFKSGNYVLDSIGTLNTISGEKKEYFLNCPSCGNNNPLSWVEGVGNLGDIIFPYSENDINTCSYGGPQFTGFPYMMSYFVVCFEHNNKVYYDTAAFRFAEASVSPAWGDHWAVSDSCDFAGGWGGIGELTSLSSFTAIPNPANNQVTLQLNVAVADAFDIDVKDVDGKTLNNHLHLGQLNPGPHNANMDISNLSPGFYLIECHTGAGSFYSKLVVQR